MQTQPVRLVALLLKFIRKHLTDPCLVLHTVQIVPFVIVGEVLCMLCSYEIWENVINYIPVSHIGIIQLFVIIIQSCLIAMVQRALSNGPDSERISLSAHGHKDGADEQHDGGYGEEDEWKVGGEVSLWSFDGTRQCRNFRALGSIHVHEGKLLPVKATIHFLGIHQFSNVGLDPRSGLRQEVAVTAGPKG